MNMLTQFGNTEQKMLSKDLLDLINQVRAQFGEPMVRLNKFNEKIEDELDGEHYTFSVVQNSNNTESVVYELTIEQCILIGMRESKGVRKNVLAVLKNKQKQITTPQDYLSALKALVESEEQKQAMAHQLQIQAPKVAFVDKYVAGNGNKTFRQVAKLLQIKEYKFREFLESNRIMYKLNGEWTAYQNHVDAKRFYVKTGVSDSGHAFNHALFTPKGIEWIAGELAKSQVRGIAA